MTCYIYYHINCYKHRRNIKSQATQLLKFLKFLITKLFLKPYYKRTTEIYLTYKSTILALNCPKCGKLSSP